MAKSNILNRLLSDDRSYDDLLRWILLIALICFGSVILWDYGFLNYLLQNDISGVSTLIIAIFSASSFYCLWFLFAFSGELSELERMLRTSPGNAIDLQGKSRRVSMLVGDLIMIRQNQRSTPSVALLQAFSSELRAPVRLGVFLADMLYKLGLLGTVIGFILMLVSMRDLGEFDVETMREALQSMTGGMAVALLTTLTGLSFGLLLRMQFNILDAQVLRILGRLVRLNEILLPNIVASTDGESDV